MKNTAIKISMLAVLAGFFAAPAFAIDQVKLTSGQVVEGTVLNDVPNRYVDIRLVNGDTKRFEHTEVASVDRDVPSRKDMDQYGNQSRGFVSLLAGGADTLDSNSEVIFNYGIKIGVIAGELGSSKLAFSIGYDRISQSFGGETDAINDINLQMDIMRIGNSGFYFGPNIGLDIFTASSDTSSDSFSTSRFEAGAQIGYEFFVNDNFSVGPEVRYDHVFISEAAFNVMKFNLAANFHF